MPIALNPSILTYPLYSVFGESPPNQTPLQYAILGYGDFPLSPSDSSSVVAKPMSGSSTTQAPTSFPLQSWSMPSKGTTMILGGISLPVSTAAAVNGKVPTFVRLGSASGISTCMGIDATVGLVKGSGNFIIDRLDPSNGTPYSLKDARIKIRTKGAFSVNNTIANAILANLTGNASVNSGYNGALMFGLPWVYKPDNSLQTAAILLEAYNGPVPLSANDEATGTKLWSKSISSITGTNIFNIASNAISLQGDMTSTVIASGTPTYIRISKAAVTTTVTSYTSLSYPKGVIQAPVGDGVDQVTFDRATFTLGQTVTLNSFTMLFYPNLG